jgi:beta-lactam-binding protein with PASTA domain
VALASARTVLMELDCAVEVKRKHSSIAKGLVIGTGAATGIYPAGQLVTLTVSEGPKKPKKRKRH